MKLLKEFLGILEGKGDGPGAKWRQGYSASGHPAGYKHKSGEVGPVGGTFTTVNHFGDEKKVPVDRYRDEFDPLAGRKQAGLTQKGEPVKRVATKYSTLKSMMRHYHGKHGPVNRLPESSPDPLDKFDDAVRDVLQKVVDGELEIYNVHSDPRTPAQEKAAEVIEQLYNDTAGERGLHADDDFEEIYDIVVKELEDMLKGKVMKEGAVKEKYTELMSAIADYFHLDLEDGMVQRITDWLVDNEDDEEVDDFLYDHFAENGRLAGGDSDPSDWIANKMSSIFKDELRPIWAGRARK